jgi:hypothetical protein
LNRAEHESDDEIDDKGLELLDQTAIEHEAFSMLLAVLKRVAATLKHLEQHSPWSNLTSTVVNIVRDSITKVSTSFSTFTYACFFYDGFQKYLTAERL